MIKLTNGDWVNPRRVVAVKLGDFLNNNASMVFIILDANSNLNYQFSTEEEARTFRDENALLISGVKTTLTRVD